MRSRNILSLVAALFVGSSALMAQSTATKPKPLPRPAATDTGKVKVTHKTDTMKDSSKTRRHRATKKPPTKP